MENDDRKRAEALLDGEKRLLEMVASGCPLEDVLEAMCRLVDTVVGESVCSILLIDRTGRFRYGAGPMLPAGYDGAVASHQHRSRPTLDHVARRLRRIGK